MQHNLMRQPADPPTGIVLRFYQLEHAQQDHGSNAEDQEGAQLPRQEHDDAGEESKHTGDPFQQGVACPIVGLEELEQEAVCERGEKAADTGNDGACQEVEEEGQQVCNQEEQQGQDGGDEDQDSFDQGGQCVEKSIFDAVPETCPGTSAGIIRPGRPRLACAVVLLVRLTADEAGIDGVAQLGDVAIFVEFRFHALRGFPGVTRGGYLFISDISAEFAGIAAQTLFCEGGSGDSLADVGVFAIRRGSSNDISVFIGENEVQIFQRGFGGIALNMNCIITVHQAQVGPGI